MEMIAVLALLVYLVIPWVNLAQINRHRREIAALKATLRKLQPVAGAPNEVVMAEEAPQETVVPAAVRPWPSETVEIPAPPPEIIPTPKQRRSFEQQLGSRLSVWAGGVALALAGFFLVKYSIQAGLLTPPVRILLGAAFGLALIQGGRVVHRSGMADGTRISQALIGAAIADLYGTVYAATTLYGFLIPPMGFTGMVVVTCGAVFLSLRYGLPIAVLSMIGGFLTPALIASPDPSAPLLFTYLLCLTVGLVAVFSRRAWWVAALAIAAAFAWVLLWLLSDNFHAGDAVWLSLYLAGTVACVFHFADETPEPVTYNAHIKRYLAPVSGIAAVLLMGLVAHREEFRLLDWALYGLLSAGALVLAAIRPMRYRELPFVALAVSIAMLAAWAAPPYATYAWVVASFAILHCGAGYAFTWNSRRPLPWLCLTSAAALGYYLVGWYVLRDAYSRQTIGFPLWGAIAFLLAVAAVETTRRIAALAIPDRSRMLAVASGTAAAFIAIGLTIELHGDFLPVAIAGEVLALAWISRAIDWTILRHYAAVLSVVFVGLLAAQFVLLAQIALYSVLELRADFGLHVELVERPVFQLAIPAILFAVSSVLLRRRDDWLVHCLEGLSACLFGLAAFYLTRTLFHAHDLFTVASFVERGVNTNVLFVCGLGGLWVGRKYQRRVVSGAGIVLAAVALFRIAYFDIGIADPLWKFQYVGETPLFNWLLLPYALPLAWITLFAAEVKRLSHPKIATILRGMVPALAFVLVSLEVAQLFRGSYLYPATIGDGETYAYSVAWLLLGIVLLFLGTLRRDTLLRVASLPVMLLTIGKVFLYDVSELDGLYRVFSFLGLGLALLGLSWFYRRFVFTQAGETTGAAS